MEKDRFQFFTISLAAARVNGKMSQEELAKKLGVHVSTIKSWERGKTSPDSPYLREISRLTGVPSDYIFLPDTLLKVDNGNNGTTTKEKN